MKKVVISTLGIGIIIAAMGMTSFASNTNEAKDIDLNEQTKVLQNIQANQTDQSVEEPKDQIPQYNNGNYRYHMQNNETYNHMGYGKCHYGYYSEQ